MADPDDKTKSDDLDLDIKKTGPGIGKDQAGELGEGDLNDVAGGSGAICMPSNACQTIQPTLSRVTC